MKNENEKELVSEVSPVANYNSDKNKKTGIALLIILALIAIYIISMPNEKIKEKEKQEVFRPNTNSKINNRKKEILRAEKYKRKQEKKDEKEKLTPEQLMALMQIDQKRKEAEEKKKKEEHEKWLAKEEKKRKSNLILFANKSKAKSDNSIDPRQNNLPIGLQAINPNNTQKDNSNVKLELPDVNYLDVTRVKKIPYLANTIGAGKFIMGVLETAVDSTLPGMVRAVVSSDIYSEDGTNILLPKGTRLVGEYRSGIKQGQERVFVIWNVAITPDGLQVPLASSGTDQLGVAGVGGDYDSHFFKRFGGALLLSVIESQSSSSDLSIATNNSLQQASAIALKNSINIPPTIYVDQGEKINIFVARNIQFL